MLFEQVRQQLNRLESVHLGLECSDNVGSTYLLDTDKASPLGEEYTRHLSSLQTKGGLAAGQLRCMDNTAALMAPFRVQAQDGSYAGKDDPEHNPIPVKAQYAETPLSVPPEPPPGQNSDRLWIKDDETNALKNVQRYLGAAYITRVYGMPAPPVAGIDRYVINSMSYPDMLWYKNISTLLVQERRPGTLGWLLDMGPGQPPGHHNQQASVYMPGVQEDEHSVLPAFILVQAPLGTHLQQTTRS